jgi:hypothetical protein
VKEMLVTAAESGTGLAVETATTLLERVLADEGWLDQVVHFKKFSSS